MIRIEKSLALLLVTLAGSVPFLNAATLSGVTLPDTMQVGGKTLLLNGLGLRTKFIIRIYVAGLYLEKKSADPDYIINSDVPKGIVLQFVHGVSKAQVADSFSEAFNDNMPGSARAQKVDIARFLAALEPVNAGERMTLTYQPGTGTTLSFNNKDKVTIVAPAFRLALFAIWFGPKPPNSDLKKGMLGR